MSSEDQIDAPAVLEKLLGALDQNGDLPPKARDHLELLALTSLLQIVEPLPRRMKRLEDRNIVMWVEKHPKGTSLIITGLILMAMFFHQITPWVMHGLGLITGFAH